MRYKLTFLFVAVYFSSFYPQQVTNWKIFTDMKNVADVAFSGETIWAATDGGAFKHSGLMVDNSGRKWFGSKNGVIDIYNEEDASFNVIIDIANSNQINKSINYLNITTDTIIVSTDFGVSLIDGSTLLFLDTFSKFGDFTANTKVNHADKLGLFFISADEGVAIQKADCKLS
jgi:ligand-binding sensor domain-containing protein